jgi:hypothetical protein
MVTTAGGGSPLVRVTVVELGETLASAMNRGEPAGSATPMRPMEMAVELAELGIETAYVAAGEAFPADDHDGILLVIPAEPMLGAALPATARRRSIVVAEVERGAEVEWLDAFGALALITMRTWARWSNGMFGTTGFYGRADVAAVACLVPDRGTGALGAASGHLELAELLARYVRAVIELGIDRSA